MTENQNGGQDNNQSQTNQQQYNQPQYNHQQYNQTYQNYGRYNQQYGQHQGQEPPKKKKKNLIIALVIILILSVLVFLGFSFISFVTSGILSTSTNSGTSTMEIAWDYVGVVYVEGTISEGVVGTYDHNYIMTSIDDMMYDPQNKGLMLHVNTPGGSVYASDELYLKILEYKETGKPVYTYMASQATSGGYYIAAPSDKIIANRNTWTGSIGVTIGTILDVSDLLNRVGVKATTITSGPNKAMGSNYEPMTPEQLAIFQSLVDEAYYQFVEIVADGRGFTIEETVKIADGRIYTANQALELGLIDEISTFEDAIYTMQEENGLGDIDMVDFAPMIELSLLDLLYGKSEQGTQDSILNEYEKIMEIVNGGNEFNVSYIADVKKGE